MENAEQKQRKCGLQKNNSTIFAPGIAENGNAYASLMGNQCALQRFTEHIVNTNEQYNLRISDDRSVMTCDENKHFFFARPAEVERANEILDEKSDIHLVNSGMAVHPQIRDALNESGINVTDFKGITAEYRGNSGDQMTATSDCGDFTRLVTGEGNLHGVYGNPQTRTEYSPYVPGYYRTSVLETVRQIIVAEGLAPFLNAEIPPVFCRYIKGTRGIVRFLGQIQAESETFRVAMSESGPVPFDIMKRLNAYAIRKVDNESATFRNYIRSWDLWMEGEMIPEHVLMEILMHSSILSERLGVNKAADPAIGEGFVTVSSEQQKVAGFENDTWEFHWGGVAMESTDHADKVVIENYAVIRSPDGRSEVPVHNTAWEFNLYGTSKEGQSFHEVHHETNKHGLNPTTIRVAADTKN